MGKWIVMAAMAAMFVLSALFVVSRPDTVRYHKAGMLTAYERAEGGTRERIRSTVLIGAGMAKSQEDIFANVVKQYREHQQALLRLGYLEERTFTTGARPTRALASHLRLAAQLHLDPKESVVFFETTVPTDGELRVVCRREDMPRVVAWMKRDYMPAKSRSQAELRQVIPKL